MKEEQLNWMPKISRREEVGKKREALIGRFQLSTRVKKDQHNSIRSRRSRRLAVGKGGNQKLECGREINTILNEGIRWINTMIQRKAQRRKDHIK